jgi:hypothetical protein
LTKEFSTVTLAEGAQSRRLTRKEQEWGIDEVMKNEGQGVGKEESKGGEGVGIELPERDIFEMFD